VYLAFLRRVYFVRPGYVRLGRLCVCVWVSVCVRAANKEIIGHNLLRKHDFCTDSYVPQLILQLIHVQLRSQIHVHIYMR
jgi:hypothetical protein